MIKFSAPSIYKRFKLNNTNPAIQKMVIDTLRSSGINVWHGTKEYDKEYPYLYWDGEMLTQSYNDSDLLGLEEFMAEFAKKASIRVKLNDSYTATVHEDGIEVGCQSFSHSVIEELAEAIIKVKNQ